MKLHGNAALSWSGRRVLARRVVVEGWTLTAAAEAWTFDGYESSLRVHLVPELGELYLTEITRKAIDSFVADWATAGPRYQARLRLAREREQERAREEGGDRRAIRLGHSAKTIGNALVPLREMLGHAVEWEYLSANPAERVKRHASSVTTMHCMSSTPTRSVYCSGKRRRRLGRFCCAR